MTARQRAARSAVLALLGRITVGRLEVVEPRGRVHRLGPGGEPAGRLEIADPEAWPVLLGGSLGLADAYVAGLWDTPDLTGVVRVAARNVQLLDDLRRRFALVRLPYQQLRGVRRGTTRRQAAQDIAAHYDLGNDLYELMLDETMMYSAGLFEDPSVSMRDASLAKLDLVCDKLDLGPDDHVVEIGTGWGGFAVHAATTRGCRVTTTTISAEQHAYAVRRVADAGVADRVEVLQSDYRDLRGEHSKLVSLEMIEAVGWRDFPIFFSRCSQLLAPDGAMLLQAITVDDRAYEVEKSSRSFIRTRIFPGGCLPSQEVIARCIGTHTDLRMAHHEDLSADYVLTLRAWRANVDRHAARLEELGYDERFRRLWRMYLCYCEGGFAERRIGVGQTLLTKPVWRGRVPATQVRGPGGLEAAAAAAAPGAQSASAEGAA